MDASQVDALFARWDKDDSPGCAVGIVRDGELVYSQGFGMASIEHGVRNTPTTVFEIASTTKQFTAACIAILHAGGGLSLHDDIRTHLPELPDYGASVTVSHLVHHTSGLPDYFALAAIACLERDEIKSSDRLLAFLARVKTLNHAPGAEYIYSNTGYVLLSLLVQRVTGQSIREFADERIFKPLGMTKTLFRDDTSMVIKDRAIGYSPKEEGGWRVDESWPDVVGDGGVHTTVEDIARWDANFYENKIEPDDLVQRLLTCGRTNDGVELDYAFGLSISKHRGLDCVSHGGGFAGFRAELARFPSQRFSVICLANAGDVQPSTLAFEVANLWLADVLESAEVASAPTAPIEEGAELTLEEFTSVLGFYQSPAGQTVAKVGVEDSQLVVTATPNQRFEMVPIAQDALRSTDGAVVVTFSNDNAAEIMHVSVGSQDQGKWRRIEPPTLSQQDVDELLGSYCSHELAVAYTIEASDGVVVLKAPKAWDIKLEPIERDKFATGFMTVTILRDDASDIVSGLEFAMARATALRFDKVLA